MNPQFIHRVSSTTFIDKQGRFDFDISEIDDEWFYISIHIRGGNYYLYKCDQLEGVFDCIGDIYSEFGWS